MLIALPESDNEVRVTEIETSFDEEAPSSITSVTMQVLDNETFAAFHTPAISLTVTESDQSAAGFLPSTLGLVHNVMYRLKVIVTGVVDGQSRKIVKCPQFIAKWT